ncbi:monocarboxylate transporter 14-like [Ruditapes philippinarum]|uniref:monocarboxylate transporter 14-like n=1 Tax=Ruditapes philippinarum TaxID=129788 RepID=UPI00295AA0BF|nr:monocarboxylate transporter 14-like [Ruditapes philippinarum]
MSTIKLRMNDTIIKVFIVLGSHFGHILSIGMSITFGILYSEIRNDFKTSHYEAAWIASIFNGLTQIIGLPLGPILVKVQERWLTVVGTLLLVVGMITSSFASAITTLYITYGLISGLGAGIIHYCSNTIVVRGYFGLFTAVVSYYLGKKQLPIGYGMISATTGISLTAGMPLAGFVSDSYGNENGSLYLEGV